MLHLHAWVETVKRFARHLEFSHEVARQLALCRRESSRRLYQHRWSCYRRWCSDTGHSASRPSIFKLADFLLFLRKEKHLSVSAIRGYRSTLSAVFKFRLPDLSTNLDLRDLIRLFELEYSSAPVGPLLWDLVKVLEYLCGPVFEPLSSKPLRLITIKTLLLLSLATAKLVGQFQALSRHMVSQGPDIFVSYLPEFVAKTESERNPPSSSLPHQVPV